MGDSAGAQLALWYVEALTKPELQAAVSELPLVEPEAIRGLLLFYGAYEIDRLRSAFGGHGYILSDAFLGREPAQFKLRN